MARRDRRRATTGALAVSALVHLALFIVLAYQAAPSLRTPTPAEPDFQVQLVTVPPAPVATQRPLPKVAPRAVRKTPVIASRPILRPRPAPESPPAARAIQQTRPAAPHAPPAPITPPSRITANTSAAGSQDGQTAGAGAQSTGDSGRWQVQGGEGEDGVRKFLRATAGCSHEDFAQLRPDERANCYRRFERDARMGKSGPGEMIPADKRAYYDATQEAYQSLHDARPRYDAQGDRTVDGHMPAVGCKIGGKNAPPNSLKIGPCFVSPPQGLFTEESGVPKP